MLSRLLLAVIALPGISQDAAMLVAPAEKNPLLLRFLTPQWQPLDELPAGTIRWGATLNYANIFEYRSNQDYVQDFDAEMASINLNLHWQIHTHWSLYTTASSHRFTGGFLDSVVQRFHQTFGLPNDNRDEVANNRFNMTLQDADGAVLFQAEPHRWYLKDPQTSLVWRQRSGPWQISSGLTLKVPVGNGPFQNRRMDGALDFQARTHLRKWGFSGQLGWASHHPSPQLKPLTRKSSVFAKLWVQRRWLSNSRLIAQLDGSTPLFKNTGLDSLDPAPVNLTLGCMLPMNDRTHLSFFFSEDITSKGPALDFSFSVGIFSKLPPGN